MNNIKTPSKTRTRYRNLSPRIVIKNDTKSTTVLSYYKPTTIIIMAYLKISKDAHRSPVDGFVDRSKSPEAPELPPGPLVFKPKSVIEVGLPSDVKVGTPQTLVTSTALPRIYMASNVRIHVCDEDKQEVGDAFWCMYHYPGQWWTSPPSHNNRYPVPEARPSEDMIKNKTEGFNTAIVYAHFVLVFRKTGLYRVRVTTKHTHQVSDEESLLKEEEELFTGPINVVSSEPQIEPPRMSTEVSIPNFEANKYHLAAGEQGVLNRLRLDKKFRGPLSAEELAASMEAASLGEPGKDLTEEK